MRQQRHRRYDFMEAVTLVVTAVEYPATYLAEVGEGGGEGERVGRPMLDGRARVPTPAAGIAKLE